MLCAPLFLPYEQEEKDICYLSLTYLGDDYMYVSYCFDRLNWKRIMWAIVLPFELNKYYAGNCFTVWARRGRYWVSVEQLEAVDVCRPIDNGHHVPKILQKRRYCSIIRVMPKTQIEYLAFLYSYKVKKNRKRVKCTHQICDKPTQRTVQHQQFIRLKREREKENNLCNTHRVDYR